MTPSTPSLPLQCSTLSSSLKKRWRNLNRYPICAILCIWFKVTGAKFTKYSSRLLPSGHPLKETLVYERVNYNCVHSGTTKRKSEVPLVSSRYAFLGFELLLVYLGRRKLAALHEYELVLARTKWKLCSIICGTITSCLMFILGFLELDTAKQPNRWVLRFLCSRILSWMMWLILSSRCFDPETSSAKFLILQDFYWFSTMCLHNDIWYFSM